MPHSIGSIWREGSKWKVKLPHGIETFSTKRECARWRAVFWDATIQAAYNK